MEEKIKEIISQFIKIPAGQINGGTIIDRSSVNNSITLHRMYAKLAEEGIVVQNYQGIKSFANLMQSANGDGDTATGLSLSQNVVMSNGTHVDLEAAHGVGIDIEEVQELPKTNDFREHEFYKMNFAASEIAYCILQPNAYASFAGLFAAKEAIAKADNTYRHPTFNNIVINHQENGKPVFPGFYISISHTDNTAVAVAVRFESGNPANEFKEPVIERSKGVSAIVYWLLAISFCMSLLAIYFATRN